MSNRIFGLAFCLGLLALGWVASGFVGTSPLALAMTAVIAAAYVIGANELRQFRAATGTLRAALDGLSAPPAALADWLARVPESLRDAVRQRIEGERGALPGPALTPYLVGLLVMLGMLGTFLGMVVTFKGTVFALQGSTDVQAIRAALAEPIRGLSLSFGTSVAGVAASALLGLMSAIARRERLEAARLLDARAAGALLPFSLAHQRQETLRAVQSQSRLLPEVAESLQAMMERIERRSEQLDAQLLERQAQLQREVTAAYAELARSVGASLQQNLAASAQATGETLRPIVQSAMGQLVQESQGLQRRLGEVAQAQAEALAGRFATAEQGHRERMDEMASLWRTELAALRQEEGRRGEAAVHRMGEWQATAARQLAALREEEHQRGDAAVRRLSDLQGAVAQHLATLGAALEAPLTRLLDTAAEVPQAAAGVISQLHEEMSRVAGRDNLALQERTVLLERLGALLQSLEQASGEQRTAIDALAGTATSVLEQAQARFGQALDAQAGRATEMAAHVSAGAVQLAGVAESFGESVRRFQASHDKLADTLQRVEASLCRSTERSDEQLAYYVAQAREVIDLSIASQQGLLDSLRQLQGKARPAALAEAGAP
ncbi:hypothetical protein [Ramlibacter sp.]|uniref:hypothetical protein n=1 Tax=Ramlibacter sp. TaxID=1917967 RepID=UPI002FCB732A